MYRAEEVVDCFDGVERGDRHFDENGVPVAHGAVPKSGEFERAEFAAVLRFFGDEACVGIDVFGQAEAVAVGVLSVADEIDGVEVSGFGHEMGVLGRDLCAFEDLRRCRAVGVDSDVRAAAWFAFVFHHSADAQRAVEFFAEESCFGLIVVAVESQVGDAERRAGEVGNTVEGVAVGGDAIKEGERSLDAVIDLHEESGDNSFVANCGFALRVGHHIVDVFDEYDGRIDVVEVFDERSVASRAEEQ